MPTYEFQCKRCRTTFEMIASIAEYERMKKEQAIQCTACGSTDVAPQIERFEVQTSRKSA